MDKIYLKSQQIFIGCILFFCINLQSFSATVAAPLALNTYHRDVPSALDSLIRQNLVEKKYKEALTLLEEQLKRDPKNEALRYQEALIYVDLEKYDQAKSILQDILALNKTNTKAYQLLDKVNQAIESLPHNEIGLGQDETYVSDLNNTWSISSLHYYRFTEYGTFGARVNYGYRFHTSGKQYQIEAYPKFFNSKVYANLSYAFSNTPQQVFPRYQYTIEPYFTIFDSVEFSFGQRFVRDFNVNIYNNTGSIGKYFGDYFIWVRSNHYIPKSVNYDEVGLRRYFNDGQNYFSIKLGGGKYPDIGDIQPFTQLILITAKSIGLDSKIKINKSVFLKGYVVYTDQLFLADKRRQLTEGGLELDYLF